jgi:Ser/Thr protein kinase RdoA (MazF antagonist)
MTHPYERLSPDLILDAVEALGLQVSGSLFNLNSYENRVIQIGIEDSLPIIAKFYRPQRWSDEAILEEHQFSLALAAEDIPVIAPLTINQQTLFEHEGFRFAVFNRSGGRWPELDNIQNLQWIGRFLGRIHQLGCAQRFKHRPSINPQTFGRDQVTWLLKSGRLPARFNQRYEQITAQLLDIIENLFAIIQPFELRLHGDCHPGNILWTDEGPHFVDMDDCRNGPAIQDLWMLLSGDQDEMRRQLDAVVEGYEMFRHFDHQELTLVEPLRTLRMIHYAVWLAKRWDDPAFPVAFTWFGNDSYWEEHLRMLEDQLALIT